MRAELGALRKTGFIDNATWEKVWITLQISFLNIAGRDQSLL